MTDKQKEFIDVVGNIAQIEYQKRNKWVLPSVCIAQAILESGFNLKAKTLFGIKGKGSTFTTKEFINGKWVTTKASFKVSTSIKDAIVGYYEFITTTPRYKYVVNNPNYNSACYYLINTTDGRPYATDPNYINKLIKIIKAYKLYEYDYCYNNLDIDTVAKDVIAGKYGNGETRKKKLAEAGYDYNIIQNRVNDILKSK